MMRCGITEPGRGFSLPRQAVVPPQLPGVGMRHARGQRGLDPATLLRRDSRSQLVELLGGLLPEPEASPNVLGDVRLGDAAQLGDVLLCWSAVRPRALTNTAAQCADGTP